MIDFRLTDSCGRENIQMAYPAREISNEEIESARTSQALKEFFRQERQSREDCVSIWWVSVGMVMVYLILVLLLIQILFSGPKNRHPTESAWYRYALPLFTILSQDRPGSVLPPTYHIADTLLPFTRP
jgi:hypothetical protein